MAGAKVADVTSKTVNYVTDENFVENTKQAAGRGWDTTKEWSATAAQRTQEFAKDAAEKTQAFAQDLTNTEGRNSRFNAPAIFSKTITISSASGIYRTLTVIVVDMIFDSQHRSCRILKRPKHSPSSL